MEQNAIKFGQQFKKATNHKIVFVGWILRHKQTTTSGQHRGTVCVYVAIASEETIPWRGNVYITQLKLIRDILHLSHRIPEQKATV